jgi:hypothetical protein
MALYHPAYIDKNTGARKTAAVWCFVHGAGTVRGTEHKAILLSAPVQKSP